MKNTFCFNKFQFDKYHHTDASMGVPYNYLAYMINGECKIVSSEKTIYIKSGDVFYIPIDCKYHSYWHGSPVEFLSFGFLPLDVSDNLHFELQVVACDGAMKERIKSLPTENRAITCRTLSLLCGIIDDLKPQMKYKKQSKCELVIENAEEFIWKNPKCTVPDIAKACLISEPYLYRIFKEEKNTTPNEFKQMLLCKKAEELLLTTNKTVEEISNILNFSSASYFRKVFKKHTGSTPREKRQNSFF